MRAANDDWRTEIDRKVIPYVEYPGYENKYPTISGLSLSQNVIDEIRDTSAKLYKIFAKVTHVFQKCPENFMEKMDIPKELIPYMNISNPLGIPTFLSRFDYVISEDGIHMVEINADTPCAIPEAYYGNEVFSQFYDCESSDPNYASPHNLEEFLKDLFLKIYNIQIDIKNGTINTDHPFVFACFDDYIEDKGNTLFLMNAMKHAVRDIAKEGMIEFVSFYDLKVDIDGSIVIPDGRTAAAIYRLHPMELLIDEVADDGDKLGKMFMDGYKAGKFKMFNPPESIIMQCKGFQALVWALHKVEKDNIFTDEENCVIEEYMLPTYFEQDAKLDPSNKEKRWIKKPIWGREGNGITVVDNNNNLILVKDLDAPEEVVQREPKTCIYQEFVDQVRFQTETDDPDMKDGYFTLSCFMLGSTPDALYARVSPEQIAGTEAYWSPIFIDDDSPWED